MKKGFTLIELLSVLIILSIVGVITVPYVLGYMEKSRVASYKTSVQTVMEAAKEYVSKYEENNDFPEDGISITQTDLQIKKSQFINGIIKRNENGEIIAVNVYDGQYCANGTKQGLIVEKVEAIEECELIDSTAPTLKIKATNVTASSIFIVAIAQDNQSGIKDYKYCIGDECSEYITSNNYEFKNLKAGQTYQITVSVRNNNYGKNEQYTSEVTETTEKIKVTTNIIDAPQFKISNSSYGTSKIVDILYPDNDGRFEFGYVIYDKDNNVIEEKKVNDNIKLTVNQNGKIKAYILYNGQEVSNELTIIGIDNEAPKVYVILNNNDWSKNKQLTIMVSDELSGLAKEAYSYDNGATWTSNNKRTYTSEQKVYVVVRDKLGNKTTEYMICTDTSLTDCSKSNGEITIEKVDTMDPELSITGTTTYTNNIHITYIPTDDYSGIDKVVCEYSSDDKTYQNVEKTDINNCFSEKLISDTTYYYQICVYDNAGNSTCENLERKTNKITNPDIVIEKYPNTAQNGYYKSQVAKIDFIDTGVLNPYYFIKTTREGIANIKTIALCSDDSEGNPTNCITKETTTLEPNKWYKVSGDLNVTYNETATSSDTLLALTYDGTNYSGATSATITKIDADGPSLTLGTPAKTKSKISVPIIVSDDYSGVGNLTCKYSTTNGTYTTNASSVSKTNCTMTGLSSDTIYYYQICATDKLENTPTCRTGSTAVGSINVTATVVNTPSNVQNGYLKTQETKFDFSANELTNYAYYIKTTRAATSSIKTTSSCGTGDTPGACTTSSVTSLAANVWYKVSGDVNVTYSTSATSQATLIAATYDGNEYDTSVTVSIPKIDRTAPKVALGVATKTTNSITIPYTITEEQSGIDKVTCEYGTSENYGKTGTATTTGCTITGVNSGTKYYYKINATDKVGNTATVKKGNATTGTINSSIALTNTPDSAISGYLKKQVASVTFSSNNLSNSGYYIKTTRAATSSIKTTSSCGTGDTPGTCTTSAVTSLAANTWYKVSGSLNVTYNATATSTATLIAATYDGASYDTSVTAIISKIDVTKPKINVESAIVATDSIIVPYTITEEGAGAEIPIVKYGESSDNLVYDANVSSDSFTFEQLTANTKYYYSAYVLDKLGNKSNVISGSVTTAIVGAPELSFTYTPSTAKNGYYKKQVTKISFNDENITDPSYFISLSRAGTSNIAVNQSCVLDIDSGSATCEDITSTKKLSADVWYKVSGDVSITHNSTSTSTGAIFAMTYDGKNYSSSTSGVISPIDATNPTLILSSVVSAYNDITINFSKSDANSGIDSVTCTYGLESGSYTEDGIVSDTKCILNSLTDNTTYYYKICVTDAVGNTICRTKSATTLLKPVVITLINTPTEAVNGYLSQQIANVQFRSTATNYNYYIKTTKSGVVSDSTKISKNCGAGTKPSSICLAVVNGTTTLNANVWYLVTGNVSITYNSDSSATTELTAAIYSSNTLIDSQQVTLSKIDKTAPTCTVTKSNTGTTSGVSASFSCTDEESGIINCVSSQTGLKKTTSYVITDNFGNAGTCQVTVSSKTQYRTKVRQACAAKSCGCSVYEECSSEDCGCKQYKSCQCSGCGYSMVCNPDRCAGKLSEFENCMHLKFDSADECLDNTGCANKCVGDTEHWYCAAACRTCCYLYNTCVHESCGCETYNTCTTTSCGCATYKTCQSSSCDWSSSWSNWSTSNSCTSSDAANSLCKYESRIIYN